MASSATNSNTSRSRWEEARDQVQSWGLGRLLAYGVAAGLFAGFAFILANMWYAITQDKPAIAPLLAISTIFRGSDMPALMPESRVPMEAIIGLIVHLGLSATFGIGFALLVPLFRRKTELVVGGFLYGLALYLINFQVIARLFFEWFQDPRGPNQVFELIIHPLAYGLLLVPFFLGIRTYDRSRDT